MTGCADAVARLWSYLDGELGPIEQQVVEGHLARCLRCCGELAFARHLQSLLASASAPHLPAAVAARLEAVLDGLDGADRSATTWSAP